MFKCHCGRKFGSQQRLLRHRQLKHWTLGMLEGPDHSSTPMSKAPRNEPRLHRDATTGTEGGACSPPVRRRALGCGRCGRVVRTRGALTRHTCGAALLCPLRCGQPVASLAALARHMADAHPAWHVANDLQLEPPDPAVFAPAHMLAVSC